MQINSKHYNSDFHQQLIDAAKLCDVNKLIQLIVLESKTLELEPITKLLLEDFTKLERSKSSPISVSEELKRRRKLIKEAGHAQT